MFYVLTHLFKHRDTTVIIEAYMSLQNIIYQYGFLLFISLYLVTFTKNGAWNTGKLILYWYPLMIKRLLIQIITYKYYCKNNFLKSNNTVKNNHNVNNGRKTCWNNVTAKCFLIIIWYIIHWINPHCGLIMSAIVKGPNPILRIGHNIIVIG